MKAPTDLGQWGGLSGLSSPPSLSSGAPPQCGAHHVNCHILLLQRAALPGSCHGDALQFSFFPILLDLLGANIRGECGGECLAELPKPLHFSRLWPQSRPLS